MRMIQYPVTLRDGYCLFNCSDADNSESYGDPLSPGICMRITKHPDKQDIIGLFNLVLDKNNPDFEEHFQQALSGKETLWKIVRVVVNCWSIRLQFASEYFYREKLRQMHESSANGASSDGDGLSFDTLAEGYVSLDVGSLRTALQFEIPHPHDSGIDVVEVECHGNNFVTVAETDGSKKRKFEIYPPREKENVGNFYVVITEFM